jgi:hypothetical protein
MGFVRTTKWRPGLLGGAAVTAALVLVASGCGGSGSGTTTTSAAGGNTAMLTWTTGVCNAFGGWKSSLQRARTSLGSNPSSSEFMQAGHQVEVATEGLRSLLQQLGPPPTATGATVKQSLDSLRAQLQSGRNKIEQTVSANNDTPAAKKAAISTLKTTATGMLDDVTHTVDQLKALDPGSELEKAFHQSAACAPFFR